jgi:hypothetical protein
MKRVKCSQYYKARNYRMTTINYKINAIQQERNNSVRFLYRLSLQFHLQLSRKLNIIEQIKAMLKSAL